MQVISQIRVLDVHHPALPLWDTTHTRIATAQLAWTDHKVKVVCRVPQELSKTLCRHRPPRASHVLWTQCQNQKRAVPIASRVIWALCRSQMCVAKTPVHPTLYTPARQRLTVHATSVSRRTARRASNALQVRTRRQRATRPVIIVPATPSRSRRARTCRPAPATRAHRAPTAALAQNAARASMPLQEVPRVNRVLQTPFLLHKG